jgi:deoxycytidylate deaminase
MQTLYEYSAASKSVMRRFQLAKNVAALSTFDEYRHGAVLIKGGNVISVGCNKPGHNHFSSMIKGSPIGPHAEVVSILGMKRSKTMKSDVYVVRINKTEELRNSKPCPNCQETLRYVGIKRVFYSVDENSYSVLKL